MDDVSDAAVAQARIEELTRERDKARAQLDEAMELLSKAVGLLLNGTRPGYVYLGVLQGEGWTIHAGGGLTAQQYAAHYFGVPCVS
jgi:hypothetical protein